MSLFPEKLLVRRYALQADLWGIHREMEELVRDIRPRQEKLDRIRESGGPVRGVKGIQWEALRRELSPIKARLEHLRQIESDKRIGLKKVETEIRRTFQSMTITLAMSEQQRIDSARMITVAPSSDRVNDSVEFDLFISHANEDKDVVRPLVQQLQSLSVRVWYDEDELTIGDSLRRSIDRGLKKSRFGVVVISPHFIRKQWTQYELDSLVAREIDSGKVILPIWHKITKDEVMAFSPHLVDKLALNTAISTSDEIALEIAIAIHRPAPPES